MQVMLSQPVGHRTHEWDDRAEVENAALTVNYRKKNPRNLRTSDPLRDKTCVPAPLGFYTFVSHSPTPNSYIDTSSLPTFRSLEHKRLSSTRVTGVEVVQQYMSAPPIYLISPSVGRSPLTVALGKVHPATRALAEVLGGALSLVLLASQRCVSLIHAASACGC